MARWRGRARTSRKPAGKRTRNQLLWCAIVSFNFVPILVGLVVVAALAIRSVWAWTREKVRESAAESWPAAEARIESFYLTHSTGNHAGYSTSTFCYLPVLQYSYSVEGQHYSGSFNLGVWDNDEDSAQATGKGWVGEKIRIRYKPSDPAVSIWLEQDGAPSGASFTEPYGSDDSIIDLELDK